AASHGRRLFVWDFVFYGSFAFVVTSSVRVAGVLLVFAYLIVPAALANLFINDMGRRLLLAWGLGVALTALGLYASWSWDTPTGPAIVSAFGAAMALVGLAFALKRLSVRNLSKVVLAAIAIVGLLLLASPKMDQPWLDAIESIAPPVQTTFLTEFERATRIETIASIERSQAELTRLRELEQNVRWGKADMDPDKVDRLRQYLAGRGEIAAGEQLVLRHLRDKARDRQRVLLGLPLLVVGAGGFYFLSAKRFTRFPAR
ncbi:MAG TPA: metal ABC transporter permease, partial [Burkholderiaceae bacterium]|nr:metal ABC transporter permease [Burkholderiaceae bacterium]